MPCCEGRARVREPSSWPHYHARLSSDVDTDEDDDISTTLAQSSQATPTAAAWPRSNWRGEGGADTSVGIRAAAI
jgi:hypothetical protein